MAEKLVEKCGISYEEAGDVLKEANYDLLEAMIILERKGRLNRGAQNRYTTGNAYSYQYQYTTPVRKSAADADSVGECLRIAWEKILEVIRNILHYYVVISSGGKDVVKIPVIVAALLIFCTAFLVLVAVVISLVNGCSYTIKRID